MRRTLSVFALGAVLVSAAARAEVPFAIVGATIHPVSGPEIADGTLLVADGTIVALGADLPVPEGARVIAARGLHLYPGFVHPGSTLGLAEIGSVRGTVDSAETGDLNAALRAEVAFNADSQLLLPALAGGIVAAHVVARSELFAGTSAVMHLDGRSWEELVVRAPVAMHLYWPAMSEPPRDRVRRASPSGEDFAAKRQQMLRRLDEIVAEARAYLTARDAGAAAQGPFVAASPPHEALRGVVAGTLPLFVHAAERSQIAAALDWAKRQQIGRLVLVSGADAQHFAARLASDQVPVLLDGVLELPARRWEPYDAVYAAAAALHAAGVRFAIGDGGGASNARNLPFHAAMAAAFGLPKEVALRSVTLSAAELLGVADRLGSLEAGKEASFFLADGDPLEIRTHIRRVWQAGREVDLTRDRQHQLWQRYRRPPS